MPTNYDFAGQMHNAGSDVIAFDTNFSSLTFEDMYDIAVNYESTERQHTITTSYSDFYDEWVAIRDLTISECADRYYSQNLINSTQLQLLYDMDGIISSTVDDLSGLQSQLSSFEDDVDARTDLTQTEKDQIIYSSVVCRYSASYWTDVANSENPEHPLCNIGDLFGQSAAKNTNTSVDAIMLQSVKQCIKDNIWKILIWDGGGVLIGIPFGPWGMVAWAITCSIGGVAYFCHK